MGSRCLFRLNQPDRKLLPAAERELCRRAEAHTGTRLGGWEVHAMALSAPAATAEPARRGRSGMDVLSLSEAPTKRYVVYTPSPPPGGGGGKGGEPPSLTTEGVGGGRRPQPPVAVEADEQLPHILVKVSGYTPRVVKGIKGTTFGFVDFVVRIGMVFDKDVPAAVAVEIEYRPVGSAALSAAVAAALLGRLAQPLVANPYSAADAAGAAPTMVGFSLRSAAVLYSVLLSSL
ncbi:hypothetical protein MMPV_005910 [Pyropia vietnamensis]